MLQTPNWTNKPLNPGKAVPSSMRDWVGSCPGRVWYLKSPPNTSSGLLRISGQYKHTGTPDLMCKIRLYWFFLSAICFSCGDEAVRPPNFVVIVVDCLGWADVKSNFSESFYYTPNVDALAARGIRFTQAYSANPVCSPTRAALITGMHPNRVNITDWLPGQDPRDKKLLGPQDGDALSLDEITMAELLGEAGYRSAFVGKWHLGEEEEFWPTGQGFDLNIGGWGA